MSYRYIAMRATTHEMLDFDVPLSADGPPRRELSGPGSLSGSITPEYARLLAKPDGLPILEEWSTALFAELDGHIRWGGLVTSKAWNGQAYSIGCAGYTTYPHGQPYLGPEIHAGLKQPQPYVVGGKNYDGKDKNHDGYVDGSSPKRKMPPKPRDKITPQADAYDVLRTIWAHLQNQNNGHLGLTIDSHDSGYALGAKDGSDPYELVWWDAKDCGSEIDDILRVAGADYVEQHAWADSAHTQISHRLSLGRRRLGRQRDDLRFEQGVNVVAVATPTGMGDDFANEMLCLGTGSGRKSSWSRVSRGDGRLRRARVITHKGTANKALLRSYADTELRRHTEMPLIPSIAIRDHPSAPLGSWFLGDRILLHLDVPWLGQISVWHRIVADEIDPATSTAVLYLTRADHY